MASCVIQRCKYFAFGMCYFQQQFIGYCYFYAVPYYFNFFPFSSQILLLGQNFLLAHHNYLHLLLIFLWVFFFIIISFISASFPYTYLLYSLFFAFVLTLYHRALLTPIGIYFGSSLHERGKLDRVSASICNSWHLFADMYTLLFRVCFSYC